jgi:hypothetical protein
MREANKTWRSRHHGASLRFIIASQPKVAFPSDDRAVVTYREEFPDTAKTEAQTTYLVRENGRWAVDDPFEGLWPDWAVPADELSDSAGIRDAFAALVEACASGDSRRVLPCLSARVSECYGEKALRAWADQYAAHYKGSRIVSPVWLKLGPRLESDGLSYRNAWLGCVLAPRQGAAPAVCTLGRWASAFCREGRVWKIIPPTSTRPRIWSTV